MSVDEQGFDRDLDYTAVDNPFWDCTDAAHPAWWRGHEYTHNVLVTLIDRWLDCPLEEFEYGLNQPKLQALKMKIRDLRAKHGF